jgi:hypothetical protein
MDGKYNLNEDKAHMLEDNFDDNSIMFKGYSRSKKIYKKDISKYVHSLGKHKIK